MTIEIQLRRLVLALLAFGLLALGGELLAMGHYEDAWQMAPLAVISATLAAIALHAASGRGLAVLQVLLVTLMAAGVLGIYLHYETNASFQRDMNPDLDGWALFARVLHAIAPPALAPGVMAQLGLLGLIYVYKHPARRGDRRPGL